IVGDISNYTAWESKVDKNDVIIHLAATVGVKRVFANAHETLVNNLNNTNIVLEIAKRVRCKVFFASTSEVYGQSDKNNVEEDDSLIVSVTDQGRSAYVISKL